MYFDRTGTTIAAIATSPGSSIGIIRISGSMALHIAKKISNVKHFSPNKISLVKLHNSSGSLIDNSLLLYFKAPRSFTGEDVVELHLHGSSLQAEDVLKLVIENGASPALNGEFSFRSVINGKMNLNDAINLSALIGATDSFMLQFARKEAFENSFHSIVKNLKLKWDSIHTLSTAILDFPDDISEYLPEKELISLCDFTYSNIQSIIDNSDKLLNLSSFSIVIAGKPNVGKSSLFNFLTNKNRAIVTEIEGTTRDYISDFIFIGQKKIEIIDTAGIRDVENGIEKLGISKSLSLIENRDLILFVVDSSKKLDEEDLAILKKIENKNFIIVANKADISFNSSFDFSPISVSAKTGEGISELKNEINKYIEKLAPDTNIPVVTNSHQKEICKIICSTINELKENLHFSDIEIISLLINQIYKKILILLGEEERETVYEKIFSSFCIGK